MVLIVQAQSAGLNAGNFAKITVNDAPVEIEKNENGHHRGVHVVIINPSNGKIELAKAYDTYETPHEFENLVFSKRYPAGHIVVAACKDDCISKMSLYGVRWFTRMGSKEIYRLDKKCGFAFIGIFGAGEKAEANEKRSMAESEDCMVSQIFYVNADIEAKDVP